jgi:hypothetical protein
MSRSEGPEQASREMASAEVEEGKVFRYLGLEKHSILKSEVEARPLKARMRGRGEKGAKT